MAAAVATSRVSGASSGNAGGGGAVGSGSTLDASAVYTNVRNNAGAGGGSQGSRPSSMLFNESGFVR